MKTNPLIVALDVDTLEESKKLVQSLGDSVDIYKIGSQLFTAYGPQAVRDVTAQGKKVFLDLKFHDIPNTVANAVTSATGLGVFMMTVHTIGGQEMMEAAVKAAQAKAVAMKIVRPLIVGVTVLTSAPQEESTQEKVLARANLAYRSGLDGVVASAHEVAVLRREIGKDFVIVTPGIRPAGEDKGDQKRTATPADAMADGSSFLVVGRPIVKASVPRDAAAAILKEIKGMSV
ncbi:MAG: orotidine-5'-phosphate decarboxylase [Candidatus Omnitrophica bacterium]|nr:orotidine-5'-phosphate decarboxylase [Candidatus Omnitrophota bacterium]